MVMREGRGDGNEGWVGVMVMREGRGDGNEGG